MALFAPIYSDEQKVSIAVAIVEKRQGVNTARQAVELAAAGTLESVQTSSQLAPFTMPLTTAQALARDERKRRKGESVPEWIREKGADDAIAELSVRLVAIASHEVTRIERQPEAKRDLERARKAAQILREARALVRGDAPKQGSAHRKARAGEPVEGPAAADNAADLVRQLRANKSGEAPHMDHKETPDDTDGVPTANGGPAAANGEEAEMAGGGINAHAGIARSERERMRERIGIGASELSGAEAQ